MSPGRERASHPTAPSWLRALRVRAPRLRSSKKKAEYCGCRAAAPCKSWPTVPPKDSSSALERASARDSRDCSADWRSTTPASAPRTASAASQSARVHGRAQSPRTVLLPRPSKEARGCSRAWPGSGSAGLRRIARPRPPSAPLPGEPQRRSAAPPAPAAPRAGPRPRPRVPPAADTARPSRSAWTMASSGAPASHAARAPSRPRDVLLEAEGRRVRVPRGGGPGSRPSPSSSAAPLAPVSSISSAALLRARHGQRSTARPPPSPQRHPSRP